MTNEEFQIESHNGPYVVRFRRAVSEAAADIPRDRPLHVIVDPRVEQLHALSLKSLLDNALSIQLVEALEDNKSLEVVPQLVRKLAEAGIRRDHLLVAIGGGILQDVTCFVASIMFRGIDWTFLPSTLLAQADSCIGSKSSINAASIKNLVGNFYPPRLISIAAEFLSTLEFRDLRSGVGEMLKAHIIDGPASYDRIAAAYESLFVDRAVMLTFIRSSLLIKKRIIELDEFDRGPRNVMNYGHSFGHAIEAATDFAVPHGIAVTIGIDMANYVARRMGRLSDSDFVRMHSVLHTNYQGYESVRVPLPRFLDALSRDKKNTGTNLTLILPDSASRIEKVRVTADAAFQESCRAFFDGVRFTA